MADEVTRRYGREHELRFGDPDGPDVIVFDFVNGASGNRHLGIMAVYPPAALAH